jgi:hypothetical protein
MVNVPTSVFKNWSEITLQKCYVGTHIIVIKIPISDYVLTDKFAVINNPKLEARKLDGLMVLEEQIHNK